MSFPRDLPFSEAVHWVCTSYQTEKANAWGQVPISSNSLQHYVRRYGDKFYDSLQEEFMARRKQQEMPPSSSALANELKQSTAAVSYRR